MRQGPHSSGRGRGISQGVTDPGVRRTGEFHGHEGMGAESNVLSTEYSGIALNEESAMRFPRSGISMARPHGGNLPRGL